MFASAKRHLDEINGKLWLVIVFYVALLAGWTTIYFAYGYRYYEADAHGLLPDLFRVIGGNLIFFGIFGIATLIPTFTSPKDEPIDRRLSFLITTHKVSETALKFIRQEIVRLCGFIETSTVDLIIREYDAASGAIRLEYRASATARNTFESESYVDDNFIIVVHPDQVAISGLFGEITLAEFGYGNEREEIVKTPLPLTKAEKFSVRTSLKIAKDSLTTYRLHNWIWYKSSESYYFHASRYTEMLTINIKNTTVHALRIKNDAGGGVELRLSPNEVTELFRGPASPGTMNVFQLLGVEAA